MFTENTGVLYDDCNVFEPYMTIMRETILSLQKKLGFTLIAIFNHPECRLNSECPICNRSVYKFTVLWKPLRFSLFVKYVSGANFETNSNYIHEN